MNNEQPILEVKDLTKKFSGLTAVNNANLYLNKGEVVGLIGANGAGKTTLFNMISGVFPPTSGKILFKGKEIQGLPPHKICEMGFGRTYQIVQPFSALSLRENVMTGALMRHPKVDDAFEIADKIIDMLGISKIKNVKGNSLTLIQLKRMEIARALATEPEILLLDEVMAGLNPTERSDLIDTMKQVKDTGMSIIIIEHVMKVIMSLSDRVYVLNQGNVISHGSPTEVMNDPEVIKSYIGEKRYAS